MTREEIHTEIGNLIKLIEINNNRMILNDADFELDVALLRSQVVKLYGLCDQLSISETETDNEPEVIAVKKEEPVVIKASPKPRRKVEVEVEVEAEDEVEVEAEAEEEVEGEVEVEDEVEVVQPEPVAPPAEPVKEEPPAPKAKHQTKKPIPSTPANDVYARLKNTKIDSIKKGISISKRYEVQNELFANNPEAYNEAIKTLDSQDSFDDAMAYLEDTLMVKHKWEEDDLLVDELRILLYRRYS